jgi:hypothetical protein
VKRHTPRQIQRRIEIEIGGKRVKTVRHRIAIAKAVRETGKDCFYARGDNVQVTRRVAGCVKVRVSWTAIQSLVDTVTHRVSLNTAEAKFVAGKGMVP